MFDFIQLSTQNKICREYALTEGDKNTKILCHNKTPRVTTVAQSAQRSSSETSITCDPTPMKASTCSPGVCASLRTSTSNLHVEVPACGPSWLPSPPAPVVSWTRDDGAAGRRPTGGRDRGERRRRFSRLWFGFQRRWDHFTEPGDARERWGEAFRR